MSKREYKLIIVCPHTGRRLCNDNRWRDRAVIGDGKADVKTFSYLKPARLTAAKYTDTTYSRIRTHIQYIYTGDILLEDGQVIRSSKNE